MGKKDLINKFNKYYNYTKHVSYDVFQININDNGNIIEQSKRFFEALYTTRYKDSVNNAAMCVFFGKNTFSYLGKTGLEIITDQEKYKNIFVFLSTLSNCPLEGLSENKDEDVDWDEAPKQDISNLYMKQVIKFIIDHNSKKTKNSANDAISDLLIRPVKKLIKRLRPKIDNDIICLLPPCFDFVEQRKTKKEFSNEVFGSDTKIIITTIGDILPCDKDLLYIIYSLEPDLDKEHNEFGAFSLVSAYSNKQGIRSFLGSLIINKQEIIEVAGIKPFSINITKSVAIQRKQKKLDFMWNTIEPKLNRMRNLRVFLERHDVTFMEEYFEINAAADDSRLGTLGHKIFELLKQKNEPLKISEITVILCEENNLINIALNDMAAVADELEKSSSFKPVALKLESVDDSKLVWYDILKTDDWFFDLLEYIPANYGNFIWQVKDNVMKVYTYNELDKMNINDIPIEKLILAIINHFDDCTTSMLAEDLLTYLNLSGNPNSLFIAKVFCYLSEMESIIISSKSREVSINT